MEALNRKACTWTFVITMIVAIWVMVTLSGCHTIAGGVKGAGMGAWEDLQRTNEWIQQEH